MDKTITTALLIVISMVMALMLFNIAYPAVLEGGDAINSMANRADERMRSQVTIIHAAGELDSDGNWPNTNGGDFEVFVWVKNVGSLRIVGYESMDVFFGPEGNFARIPHQSESGGAYPFWVGQLENSTDWDPTTTLKVTIHYQSPLSAGRYLLKVNTPMGVGSEYFMGM